MRPGTELLRPGRHLRQRQIALHRVRVALADDAAGPFVQGALVQLGAEHGLEAGMDGRARIGRLDGALGQSGQGGFHGRALAAPPGGQRRQGQFLAQQAPRQRRQEAQQRGRFEEGRARHVGDQQVAGADHLQQAGHAQGGVGPQFEGVEEGIVQPLDEAVHRPQALQRLEVQTFVAHGEVVALHQRHAQVARQVGVLEVGLVVRAGREQGDVRRRAGRAHALQAVHHGRVGGRQALHLQRFEGLWKLPGHGQPVLQQVAQARGRLGALRHHPPVAVRPAGQVEGGDAQPRVARRLHAVHLAQVAGMAAHQRRGQQAFLQQRLWPVDVGHHPVEDAHALQHPGLDLRPAAGCHDQREEVQRPGPLRPVSVRIDVVGDAVVADLALQAQGAPRQVGEAFRAELLEELRPGRRERFRGF